MLAKLASSTHLLTPPSDYMRLILRRKVIGHTSEGCPFCGHVPGKGNPFVLTVYNGGAMPLIFEIAKDIAKMIREDVPFEQSSIPRIFKITEEWLKKDIEPRV
jgi:hypothetical protein